MKSRSIITGLMAFALNMSIYQSAVYAQPTATQPPPKSEPIYGYGMMSAQERNEYREKMRSAHHEAERSALRDEHHKLMEARMRERGREPMQMHGGAMGSNMPRNHGRKDPGMGMAPRGSGKPLSSNDTNEPQEKPK